MEEEARAIDRVPWLVVGRKRVMGSNVYFEIGKCFVAGYLWPIHLPIISGGFLQCKQLLLLNTVHIVRNLEIHSYFDYRAQALPFSLLKQQKEVVSECSLISGIREIISAESFQF